MFFRGLSALVALASTAYAACTSCTSCANSTSTCQVNRPGGLILLTTFWDYNPSTGPGDSFTIHGQWPDYCNGGYGSSCDSSRAYMGISSKLKNAGKTGLLNFMNKYWVDINGDNESFWEHEVAKHMTCISTLDPSCYPNYTQYEDLFDFLQTTTDLFKSYDIYGALTDAGITPSSSKTYTLSQMQAATKAAFGQTTSFRCTSGNLNEVYIYFHTNGRSTTTDAFTQVAPLAGDTNCPSTGIKWLPKN
ncbi:ribonuclease T2 [Tilletiaria anomala UBC 951]|uniref:Ribonuclease T2 n=1 Tax=Tilletiaria anomala (strain ATCC 24038 / CBS 436.72 / UBC 951) TaxID=1037660 RepID=A0A066WRK3_TILAU|nr:ribonuclease T2 [Tilletiaria anomala UBC 951]KDN53290.1 ribonuclease T2 [Tilletiaria anomala UBC 951]